MSANDTMSPRMCSALIILHTNSEFRKLQAFRLMFYNGILDCTLLICNVYGGIIAIWPAMNTHLPYLNRV
ncbi:hypothetical protein KIN20_015346 [Parelaphostrongylus tenuis]|uniref:Uncharacterized protein n=1 Tax=Parelaphostrongylus tenuis TaxID=148309 RepID=A0AAD5N0I9_PARTN|nr:hypothetical protein KIN20_015346 [Parelaphostrongylus tenuis]